MPPPNYYAYLGAPTNATEEELKKAYRRRSMELHPDKNPGNPNATAGFQALQKAWHVLKDPYRKAHYDWQLGLRSTPYQAPPPPPQPQTKQDPTSARSAEQASFWKQKEEEFLAREQARKTAAQEAERSRREVEARIKRRLARCLGAGGFGARRDGVRKAAVSGAERALEDMLDPRGARCRAEARRGAEARLMWVLRRAGVLKRAARRTWDGMGREVERDVRVCQEEIWRALFGKAEAGGGVAI